MRWELSQDQEMYRESFRGWVEKFAPNESVRAWLTSGDARDFENRFVAEGWFSVGLSEDVGGQGGGGLELALTAVELARRSAPSGAWIASVLAAPFLGGELGVEVLQEGEFAALVADSTRPLDSAPRLRVADGKISGDVSGVLGGDRARHLVVPVLGPDGVQVALVSAEADGVTIEATTLLDRSRSAAKIRFDGVAADVLDVDAPVLLANASLVSAVLIAADSLGAMERMLDLAVEYSKSREQFGVPIGSFQAVKHAAASILVSVEAARSIVFYAAESIDAGMAECDLHAATAKAQVTASGAVAADSALTMHGAVGYTWEHDLHFLYKRTKLNKALFGSPSVWNERIARSLPLVPFAPA
ncbi:acyl-CoA dehydrogenase family protein [Rhodococcoides kyotonense]|uniref:Acyl-CoA dehydrogenase n=1 Tax=Rhodococcoides kyotonense TaxID=398843 RepID=A0A239K2P0_9NOCA|nr:acyl-CoA dehydrogenase [Rhodococcus kyotonensis]SNT12048.1 Acyl-CoA dehydrogenase [Rhodococcus kyotonensis]